MPRKKVRRYRSSSGVYDVYHTAIHGLCTSPCDAPCPSCHDEERSITIDPSLKGLDLLETIIHEAMHAEDPNRSEEVVTREAHNIANLVWRWGYRLK